MSSYVVCRNQRRHLLQYGPFFRGIFAQGNLTAQLIGTLARLIQGDLLGAANAQLPSLPGEKLRTYDPNWFRLFFLENGDFDRRSGLSQ